MKQVGEKLSTLEQKAWPEGIPGHIPGTSRNEDGVGYMAGGLGRLRAEQQAVG